MSQFHTHYENLFVTRNAPVEVIRAAYKALAQKYHPDRNKSQGAERVMKLVNEAWHVLGDATLRREHDEQIDRGSKTKSSETSTSAQSHDRASQKSSRASSQPSSAASQALLRELEALAEQLWFKNHTYEHVLSYLVLRGLQDVQARSIADKVFK
jgi:DnaJ-class molecular chaperone